MKHVTIGIDTLQVYRVTDIKLNGDGDKIIPRTSPHKKVIEITNAEAKLITNGDPREFWYIDDAGSPTNVHPIGERPVFVPNSISAWQAEAALKLTPHADGTLYDAVHIALNAMEDGQSKVIAQTAFSKGANFIRTSPTIARIALELNLSDIDVDTLFVLGGSFGV